MMASEVKRLPLLLCLLAYLLIALTAGGASPLATQNARIGPYDLLLSYYSLPRAGQALNMTIESGRPGERLQFSQAVLKPAPGTDGNIVPVVIMPDSENSAISDVNVTPPVRGSWLLHLRVTGPSGPVIGDVPIAVEGPPAIPLWLGWLIGLVPLPLLCFFIWWQVRWRKAQRHRLETSG